jgi:hypothetical protein
MCLDSSFHSCKLLSFILFLCVYCLYMVMLLKSFGSTFDLGIVRNFQNSQATHSSFQGSGLSTKNLLIARGHLLEKSQHWCQLRAEFGHPTSQRIHECHEGDALPPWHTLSPSTHTSGLLWGSSMYILFASLENLKYFIVNQLKLILPSPSVLFCCFSCRFTLIDISRQQLRF